ncbi:hypothetical protein AVEN_249701-1, partial [Araneus ventricosus]
IFQTRFFERHTVCEVCESSPLIIRARHLGNGYASVCRAEEKHLNDKHTLGYSCSIYVLEKEIKEDLILNCNKFWTDSETGRRV